MAEAASHSVLVLYTIYHWSRQTLSASAPKAPLFFSYSLYQLLCDLILSRPWQYPVTIDRTGGYYLNILFKSIGLLTVTRPTVDPQFTVPLSSIEPTFADYNRNVRDLTYHHPELPDRLTHVLAFASIPLATIQGHDREARRELWRHLPELTAPGRPLQGVFPALPIELASPQPCR